MIASVDHACFERDHGVVLRDICFSVRAGERVALVGANGAGKSSLLRLLAGVEQATSGAVRPVPSGSGYVPQSAGESLFPWFSVLKNVAMPRLAVGLADALEVARERLRQIAPSVSPERRAAALSGGEKQAVAIARALAAPGPIVLADEPFSALAAATRPDVRRAMSAALGDRALVLVTHDLADAAALGARVIQLVDGQLAEVRS